MFSYEPLAKTLKEKDMKVAELAEKAGLSKSVLLNKLNGNEYLSALCLDKICTALNVPIEKVVLWKKGEQNSSERIRINWEKVICRCKEKRLSLNELSRLCGLNSSSLYQLKKRDSGVKQRIAGFIAQALECNVEDLL